MEYEEEDAERAFKTWELDGEHNKKLVPKACHELKSWKWFLDSHIMERYRIEKAKAIVSTYHAISRIQWMSNPSVKHRSLFQKYTM